MLFSVLQMGINILYYPWTWKRILFKCLVYSYIALWFGRPATTKCMKDSMPEISEGTVFNASVIQDVSQNNQYKWLDIFSRCGTGYPVPHRLKISNHLYWLFCDTSCITEALKTVPSEISGILSFIHLVVAGLPNHKAI